MTPPPETPTPAAIDVRLRDDGALVVAVSGTWRLRAGIPGLHAVQAAMRTSRGAGPREIAVQAGALGDWDSSLAVFVIALRDLARQRGLACNLADVPDPLRRLCEEVSEETPEPPAAKAPRKLVTTWLGEHTHRLMDVAHDHIRFFGECVQALARVVVRPLAFRWIEGFDQMRRCGAAALPIVGLISALVGVILAFVAAVQLRQFGADIFVADLVGLAVFREMGPMMAAIVLTGRTGAAFAAELGNMVLGEEVDALETFGVRPVDFLVAPRLLALVLMMPLLAIYANFLGVLGGALVARGVLDIAPEAFFVEMQTAVGLKDIGTGLLKSAVFGWIVAYSGCFRGMRAGRSSVAVGEATTGAVVMGILLIIVADATFTVIFNTLGW